jgi:hypothetical protein
LGGGGIAPGLPTAGGTNTGGGGGGNRLGGSGGANGGSGIVIIRYSGSPGATGGTITTPSGNTVHTFTGDGTFTSNADTFIIN